jgi:ESCRT-I complex subunit VPS28
LGTEIGLTGRYTPACIKLLAQYKSLMKLVSDEIGTIEAFMKRFKVGHPVFRYRDLLPSSGGVTG